MTLLLSTVLNPKPPKMNSCKATKTKRLGHGNIISSLFPKQLAPVRVNLGTIWAGDFGWFVFKVARKYWLFAAALTDQAAICYFATTYGYQVGQVFADALVINIPLSHLPEKQELVHLIFCPRHVEQICIGLPIYYVANGVPILMVMKAAGEHVGLRFVKHLDMQSKQGRMLIQQLN